MLDFQCMGEYVLKRIGKRGKRQRGRTGQTKKMQATKGADRFENKTKIVKLVICSCTLKSQTEKDMVNT